MRIKIIVLLLLSGSLFYSCDRKSPKEEIFSQTYVQPSNGYAQMVVTRSVGQKMLHISGQVGEGETLEIQMRSALSKIRELLKQQGADYKDLVKINTYIVDYKPTDLDIFRSVRRDIFGEEITPASTLVGVQSLAMPAWKIEIDAVAVVN